MKWRSLVLASLVTAALGIPASAHAALITGTLGIGGGVTYDTLNTSGDAGLDFDNTFLPPPTTPTGPFIQLKVATGYFAGLGLTPLVTTGQIKNISDIPAGANYAVAPAGVPISVTGFLDNFVNPAVPGLHFNLEEIPLQPGPTCPPSGGATSCVEGPFVITQTATGLRIDFDVLGTFVNGADSGKYIGSFGITINDMTFATLGDRLTVSGLDIACGTNNLEVPCQFSADFNPLVLPEPATLLTFGLGSLALTRLLNGRNKD
jgi:hypothetical protein